MIAWNLVSLHSPSPTSLVSMLSHKWASPSKETECCSMLAYIYESHGKKNLVPVNMSKSGPKICVNSYYAETE